MSRHIVIDESRRNNQAQAAPPPPNPPGGVAHGHRRELMSAVKYMFMLAIFTIVLGVGVTAMALV